MQRRFVIHCGPTNSGKTYASLQALKRAESGCYLGPLRLLALEVFDTLNSEDVLCSLLTGEESIEIPFSNITASTIEMCSFQQSYQVAVIDEAQLIADRVRGGHWLNAILRLRAEEIHICVAPEGLQLIENLIAQTLSPYEIIYNDRLVPLNYAGTIPPNDFTNTHPGDAYIAFSRKAVLGIAAELETLGIHASVIYGALPPQSRREEVRKFASGETTVIVATDAIGMGVSLPIRRVIFCQVSKYDGVEFRQLTPTEIKQISGRAVRFGKYDEGQVLTMEAGPMIEAALEADVEPFTTATIPFPKEALNGGFSLPKLLKAWGELPPVPGFCYEDMYDAGILYRSLVRRLKENIKEYPDDQIFRYITCPADTRNQAVIEYWTDLAVALMSGAASLPKPKVSTDSLTKCESSYKRLDVQYQMLRRAGIRIDVTAKKQEIEQRINGLLNEDKAQMRRTCSHCGILLPPTARFNMCDKCSQAQREKWEQARKRRSEKHKQRDEAAR
ncbi:MAG: helicase [Oscillospiraceae bacterium]|nr:helicase [Oscillospiraceae bacterium]